MLRTSNDDVLRTNYFKEASFAGQAGVISVYMERRHDWWIYVFDSHPSIEIHGLAHNDYKKLTLHNNCARTCLLPLF
jgi:hypothetical protein